MHRKIERINESFDREVMTFESDDEAASYRRITPPGDYPMPGVPGHVLRVTFDDAKAPGRRIIEVTKPEATAAKTPEQPPVDAELEAKLNAMTDPQLEQYGIERGVKLKGLNRKQRIGAILAKPKE